MAGRWVSPVVRGVVTPGVVVVGRCAAPPACPVVAGRCVLVPDVVVGRCAPAPGVAAVAGRCALVPDVVVVVVVGRCALVPLLFAVAPVPPLLVELRCVALAVVVAGRVALS